ncbi:MAG: TonB-dependent receptor [Halieaceae bacterium]
MKHLPTLLLLCTTGAAAQQPTSTALEELVITSSRVPMPMRQIGTSVSVIERAEIEQRGYSSLYEILRSQPAVAASNAGGQGSATSVRIRGEEGYRTMVLIDDIDISDTSGTQISPRFEQLLSSGIQRVEILRGPQGLMYGADAGGVINITSITPEEGLGGQLSAEAGRYGTQQFAGYIGGSNDRLDFNLSAADLDSDGFNARSTDTDLRDDDGYQNITLHGRLGWNVTDALRLGLTVRDVDGDNQYDGCFTVDTFAPSNDCRDEFEQTIWRVAGDYTHGNLTHQLAYSENDTDKAFFSENRPSFAAEGSLEKTSYLGSFKPSDSLQLVYGVDLETESIDDGAFDEERDQDGYYLEYQGGFNERLYVTAGARYDDNDDFGSNTSYRVSGAWLTPVASGELKFKGSYGTGFRAPSLYEIAYNGGAFAFPPASDVTLDAEESEGFELGLTWTSGAGLYLEANYFDQTVGDEIFFDLAGFSGYLQSDGDSDSQGVELIALWPLAESLTISGNYTYNDTETEAGSARAFRPEQLANVGVNWLPLAGNLTLGLNMRISRDAEDVDGTSLDDYEVMDLNASVTILQGLEIYGRVENLLDEDYQEIPTYNTSERAAYAGIRYSF